MTLERLLNPRNLAVIGGTECERVIEQCDKIGFRGEIWPIHPKRDSLGGRTCLRSLDELPKAPDAAYIAVNREKSIEVARRLAALGCGGAVCYAAGFAETVGEDEKGSELQDELVKAAGSMPLIGPNCYGFVNLAGRVALWPDQHGGEPCERGVAIITQSSNIAINLTMQKRALPVAMVMTVGNQAQIGLSSLGAALIEDKRITALGLHIEGLEDVKAFERLGRRAQELGKPIIVLKVGKTEQAKAATLTHTASLAGSDAAYAALFDRLGMARAEDLSSFIESLKLLHCGGPLGGNMGGNSGGNRQADILSLSCSGGEASLMADHADDCENIRYRPFTPEQASALKRDLGALVTISNPLDYNTFIWGDWRLMERMFANALSGGFDLALLVMDFPRGDRCDTDDWLEALTAFENAIAKTGARGALVSSLPETLPEPIAARLIAKNIAPLCGLRQALQAAQSAAFISRSDAIAEPLFAVPPAAAPAVPQDSSANFVLDEAEAKAELSAKGISVPKGIVMDRRASADKNADKSVPDMQADLNKAVQSLEPPFVLKGLGFNHKTEHGAVRLDLRTAAQIEKALNDTPSLKGRFLLEEMETEPIAELIIGLRRDVLGMLLTIGSGGIFSELHQDAASLLLPADKTALLRALQRLKIFPLLAGYRGRPRADMDCLIQTISSIADYGLAQAEVLEELDINPLFVTSNGTSAIDALIVKTR